MKNILRSMPVFLLILLYVYAVTSKLSDIGGFREQLYNQTFPHALAEFLITALPAAEIVTVALLLFQRTLTFGLLVSLTLLFLFTCYIILVKFHFWDRVPCSCGGILSKMTWTTHLIFNLAFICMNLAAIYVNRREKIRADDPAALLLR